MVYVDCPKDSYLNPENKECEPCHTLCHQAEVTGKERECRLYCPVASPHETQEVPQTTVSSFNAGGNVTSVSEMDSTLTTLTIILSSLIIIVALYGLYHLFLRNNNQLLCFWKESTATSQTKTIGEMLCRGLCMVFVVRYIMGVLVRSRNEHVHYTKTSLRTSEDIEVITIS